jgi:hypothetical protein
MQRCNPSSPSALLKATIERHDNEAARGDKIKLAENITMVPTPSARPKLDVERRNSLAESGWRSPATFRVRRGGRFLSSLLSH